MGYVVDLVDSEFFMDRGVKRDALEAIVKLMEQSGHEPDDKAFKWLNGVDHREWDYLKEAMDDWRWPIELDDDRQVVGIDFRGEKLGDETDLFTLIAPYVEDGSYLKMRGGDGDEWTWVFDEGGRFYQLDKTETPTIEVQEGDFIYVDGGWLSIEEIGTVAVTVDADLQLPCFEVQEDREHGCIAEVGWEDFEELLAHAQAYKSYERQA